TCDLPEEKWRADPYGSPVISWNSIHSAPDHVFVISAIDQGVHFSIVCVAKHDTAFDPLAEKDFTSLREELFTFSVALHIQIFAFRKDPSRLAGRQFVGAAEIGKFFRVDPGGCGIFIIAHCLA